MCPSLWTLLDHGRYVGRDLDRMRQMTLLVTLINGGVGRSGSTGPARSCAASAGAVAGSAVSAGVRGLRRAARDAFRVLRGVDVELVEGLAQRGS
jgi:hypothetical protein